MTSRQAIEAALHEIKANGEMWGTANAEMAILMYNAYESYKKAGFTASHALSLVKSQFLGK